MSDIESNYVTIQLLKTYLYDQQICHIRIKQLKQEKPTNLNADTSNTFVKQVFG